MVLKLILEIIGQSIGLIEGQFPSNHNSENYINSANEKIITKKCC